MGMTSISLLKDGNRVGLICFFVRRRSIQANANVESRFTAKSRRRKWYVSKELNKSSDVILVDINL